MGARERYQLIVESQTRGEVDVRRFSDTLNKLADVVDRSNKRTASSTEVSARKVVTATQSARKEIEQTGFSIQRSLSSPLDTVSSKLLGGASGLSKFAGAAAGITAAVAVTGAGLKTFIQGVSETAFEIKSLSQSTGLTISQADKLRAAANLTGFDIRNLQEAALDLSVALKDSGGQGDQTRQLLQQLGVAATTAAGDARPLGPVLLETFQALSKIDDVTKRVNLSRVLGGEDAAKRVQPLLAQFQEVNRVAAELGYGTRDNLLKALEESNLELRKFDAQWEIIKGKLAAAIAPIVVPISVRLIGLASGDLKQLPGAAFQDPGKRAQEEVIASMFPTIGGESLDRFAPKVPAGALTPYGDPAEGRRLADRFRSGQSATEDGMKFRLDAIGKQRDELRQKLSSGSLAPAAFRTLDGQLAALSAEEVQIRRRMKQIEAARAGAEITIESSSLVNLNTGATIRGPRTPSLLRRGENPNTLIGAGSGFATSEAAIAAANPDDGQMQARAQFQATADQQSRQRTAQLIGQELQFQIQKVELLTGPGGEMAAVEKIAQLRRAALEQEMQSGAEIFDLRERQLAIEEERELRLVEIQRRRREETRALTSELVGFLQAGRPGDFLRQQGSRFVNQLGTNALEGVVSRAQGALGQFGASTGLGPLLAGTILDPANATPVDKNTAATERNTAALERATGGGVPGVAGGGISGLLGLFGSDTNGITGRGPITAAGGRGGFVGGLGSVLSTGLFGGLSAKDGSVQLGDGAATTKLALGLTSKSARVGNVIGSAAVLGTATLGAIDGFKRGGAGGNLQGVGSVLGAAALIPGPQQPFVAAGALIAGFVASVLPNPKVQRAKQINSMLDAAYYGEAEPTTYNVDQYGRGYDTNRRGDIRSMGSVAIYISAVDGPSVERLLQNNRSAVADVVGMAMLEGHPINRAAREVVLAS